MDKDPPSNISQSAFAKAQGWSPSYVNQLKKAGRLVMDANGRVNVAASLQLIKDTSGGRDDVAARNAASRGQETPPRNENRAAGQARKENAQADIAEMERDRLRGLLVDKGEALAVIGDVCVTLRQALENMPHMVAPVLVGKDQEAIRATLKEEINIRLKEMERSFTEQVRNLGEAQA